MDKVIEIIHPSLREAGVMPFILLSPTTHTSLVCRDQMKCFIHGVLSQNYLSFTAIVLLNDTTNITLSTINILKSLLEHKKFNTILYKS